MGRGGFEPPKENSSGFTARPIWPLWYLPQKPQLWLGKASEGIRTPDPLITNQPLYQLSYAGTNSPHGGLKKQSLPEEVGC